VLGVRSKSPLQYNSYRPHSEDTASDLSPEIIDTDDDDSSRHVVKVSMSKVHYWSCTETQRVPPAPTEVWYLKVAMMSLILATLAADSSHG
jgi:hypothetical protein